MFIRLFVKEMNGRAVKKELTLNANSIMHFQRQAGFEERTFIALNDETTLIAKQQYDAVQTELVNTGLMKW